MGRYWDVLKASLGEERARKKPNRNSDERQFQAAAIEILETPASPIGRTIAMLIMLFVVITVTWSWIGRIDIHATLQGKIVPVGQVKVIEPLINGSIAAIHVTNGDKVTAGELLVEFDPTEHRAERLKHEKDLISSRLVSARLATMLRHADSAVAVDAISFETPPDTDPTMVELQTEVLHQAIIAFRAGRDSLRAEMNQRQRQVDRHLASIAERDALLSLAEERRTLFQELHERELGLKSRYLESAQSVQEQVVAITGERGQLLEAEAAIEALEARLREARETFYEETLAELADNERRIAALEEELTKAALQERRTRIPSPVSGTVQQLSVHTIGEAASAGQVLMTVVPKGTRLEIEAQLLNKDKGFVRQGHAVRVKLEAFPFTKYGTLNGEVASISNDAISQVQADASAQQPSQAAPQQSAGPLVFPVRIALEEQSIMIDGEEVPLTPGMAVQAEVKTGQRRVIEFLFDPLLRFTDEALRER